MNIRRSITELVGETPLFEPTRLEKLHHARANVFCKLEYLNPAGSIKDRAALNMIEDAEQRGLLKSGSVIVEPTSGNTGIGLAAISASRGYKVILTMPDTMSIERIKLLRAYGAEIVLTPGKDGMKGAIEKANEIASNTKNSFIPGQFENKANAMAHTKTTGPEIFNALDGKIDCLIAGVGTGGTITGIGNYLRSVNKDVKIVAVEPYSSPLLSKGYAGAHGLQGIGANFVPEILDTSLIDEIITVNNEDAYSGARELAREEGLLVGITSGAALHAAWQIANRDEFIGKNIVVILPDTGDRYLSTPLFED